MATKEIKVCDVFTDYPRLKVEDVTKVDIVVSINGAPFLEQHLELCVAARARLSRGIERLLKPPAKREKDTPDA